MRLVISFVGGIGLLCVVGVVLLTLADKAVPDVLPAALLASLTGIVGLLAKPESKPSPDANVTE